MNTKAVPFADRGETFSTYKVLEVHVQGEKRWTVLFCLDGIDLGGDHHWLSQEMAGYAAKVYEFEPHLHGRPSLEVIRACSRYFGNGSV